MKSKFKDVAVVSLLRNCKSVHDYYIRIDTSRDKIALLIEKLRHQFEFDIELATQIEFEMETEIDFYQPAKMEADDFIRYLKNVVSTNYKENPFLGGWYEIKNLESSKNWLSNFKTYKAKCQDELMRESGSQIALF